MLYLVFVAVADGRFTDSTNKLETSLMRYYLVHAVQSNRLDKVQPTTLACYSFHCQLLV